MNATTASQNKKIKCWNVCDSTQQQFSQMGTGPVEARFKTMQIKQNLATDLGIQKEN